MKVNTYLIVTRYLSSRTSDRQLYITLGCEHGGGNKPRTKPRVDDEEEEVHVKRRGPYAAKLTEEQLKQTEQFRKSHLPPRNILRFFENKMWKIYIIVAKIKKNRIQGRNMVEEILCLSAQRGHTDTVFLNIDSLIEGQIADIKASLEYSKTKEKLNAKSNPILRILIDIEAFWKTLEIGSCHPLARQHDMDSDVFSY
ncbi:hypothetical protein M9H77_02817 [Catharanthus roseus]|uniref:Uncharacterized protein n=1 Tax=Catharanthus roseus TaxID=4058 RepID=A0ACC0C9G2_CATRO|nr:hypothetical protein M9H77_02817 [Catharanthus roseus]